MVDLFETIFIWSLYLVLPAMLLHRFLGPRNAGLIFTGITVLSQTANPDIYQTSFPTTTIENDSTTILVKDRSGNRGQPRRFVPHQNSPRNSGAQDHQIQAALVVLLVGQVLKYSGYLVISTIY